MRVAKNTEFIEKLRAVFSRELDVSLNDRVTNASVEFFCRAEWRHLQVVNVMHTRIDETGIQQLILHVPHLLELRWRNTVNVLARICHDRSSTSEVPRFALHRLMADRTYLPLSLQSAVFSCLNAVQVIFYLNHLLIIGKIFFKKLPEIS